jgi:uncharacterized protein (DUF58 family)
VRTWLTGAYASAFRGAGIEFDHLRPYATGDDLQRLDWRVLARRREPYVRCYTEERELRILLLLDISPSLDASSAAPGNRERMHECAALLALAAAANRDRVGAVLFADRVIDTVSPGKGRRHAMSIVVRLLAGHPCGPVTDLRPALSALRSVRRNAVAVLISDLACEPPVSDPGVANALAACARKHDLRALILPDLRRSAARDDHAILALTDAESGRRTVLTWGASRSSATSLSSTGAPETYTDILKSCGVLSVQLQTDEPPFNGLRRLLHCRATGPRRRTVG